MPVQKKRKRKDKRSNWSQVILKSKHMNSIKYQGPRKIILCGSQLNPLGSWALPLSHASPFMKGSRSLQLSSFISLFWWNCRVLTASCHLVLSLPHSVLATWPLKNFMSLLCMSWEFTTQVSPR